MLKLLAAWFRIPMAVRILGGFFLGLIAGLAGSFLGWEPILRVADAIKPLGTLMLAMLKMVVIPIILFSLIRGTAALPLKKSGKVGATVILWFLVTSGFAAVFGISIALLVSPAINTGVAIPAETASVAAKTTASLENFLKEIFCNPFEALSSGNFLAIVVFATLSGAAIRVLLDSEETSEETSSAIETLLNCIRACDSIVFKLLDWIMEYFPIGIFILTFVNFAHNGVLLLGPYITLILSVAAGLSAMIFVVYPLLLLVTCHENPYRIMLKFREPMFTAFTTRSSFATLPVSIRTLNKIGISPALTSFSLPLGSTVNMDGACVLLPSYAVLAANTFGVTLTATNLAIILFTVLFASIGAGGIPNGSLLLLFVVLKNIGLQEDQISSIVALAFGIDPILDMIRTTCNCTGDMVCTYAVAKRSGMLTPKER